MSSIPIDICANQSIQLYQYLKFHHDVVTKLPQLTVKTESM